MNRLFLSACASIMCTSASSAEEPPRNDFSDDFKTELAASAKKELANFASNILAATICKGANFNSDGVVPLMVGVHFALNKEDAQSSFFEAMRRNLAAIHDNGESSWCAETLKAAKARHSQMLISDDSPESSK